MLRNKMILHKTSESKRNFRIKAFSLIKISGTEQNSNWSEQKETESVLIIITITPPTKEAWLSS